MGFWPETTDANREMNVLIKRAAGRCQPLSASPEHDRLSAALTDFERVKHLPDDADEKVYAALVLEKATKRAEHARLHPRNPDDRFASFDGGVRGRLPKPSPGLRRESANALFQRALQTSRQEHEEARSDPGQTIYT